MCETFTIDSECRRTIHEWEDCCVLFVFCCFVVFLSFPLPFLIVGCGGKRPCEIVLCAQQWAIPRISISRWCTWPKSSVISRRRIFAIVYSVCLQFSICVYRFRCLRQRRIFRLAAYFINIPIILSMLNHISKKHGISRRIYKTVKRSSLSQYHSWPKFMRKL